VSLHLPLPVSHHHPSSPRTSTHSSLILVHSTFYIHGIQKSISFADIDSELDMNHESPTHSPFSSDDSNDIAFRLMPAPDTEDRPGFPTYAQYKHVEASYLNDLAPKKRFKALITQAMFDDIWDVLHHPKALTTGTPQFRYWVRKMFTLGLPKRDAIESPGTPAADDDDDDDDDDDSVADTDGATPVTVLHDGRPVAIMEHLYEVLCYCHGLAKHGGRDKTCAVIRERYTWVPKDLTARFVKACPTCAKKRNRNCELVAQFLKQPRVRKEEVDSMSVCSRVEEEVGDDMSVCSGAKKEEADDMDICSRVEKEVDDMDMTICSLLPVTPRPKVPSIPPIPESPRKKVCRFDKENDYPTELRARGELFFPSDPFKVQDSSFVPTLRNTSWSTPPPKDCGSVSSELPAVHTANPRCDSFFSDADAGNNLDTPLKPRFLRPVLSDISNIDNRTLNNSWPSIEKCISPTLQPLRVAKPVNLQPLVVSVSESCWCGFSHRSDRGPNNVVECYSPTLQLPKVAGSLDLQLPFVPEPCWNGVSHLALPNRAVFQDAIGASSVAAPMAFSSRTIFQDAIGDSSIVPPMISNNGNIYQDATGDGSIVPSMIFNNGNICQDATGDGPIVPSMIFNDGNISQGVHDGNSVSHIEFSNTNVFQYANGQGAPFTYSSHMICVDGEKARGQAPLFMDWMPSSVCRSQNSIYTVPSLASVGPLSPFDFDLLCPELALGTDISADVFSPGQAYSTERVLFH